VGVVNFSGLGLGLELGLVGVVILLGYGKS